MKKSGVLRRLGVLKALLLLVAVQAFFWYKASDYESHFFVWGVIWLTFFVGTVFNTYGFFRGMQRVSADMAYHNPDRSSGDIEYNPRYSKWHPYNLGMKFVYGLLFLANLIGYIIIVRMIY
ncbi:MAG: hypothetical protein K8R73_12150 [Clostridiales bacterium]|jgi:hypothetical protein|nr:hypothetical protein [Clostridiales bacterium]MDW7662731.1 hypothetical protein [Bacillota bacterium]